MSDHTFKHSFYICHGCSDLFDENELDWKYLLNHSYLFCKQCLFNSKMDDIINEN